MHHRYRPCVGALLRRDARLLMGRRVGGCEYPWQFPQGGIEVGESGEEALWRELSEELGLASPSERCRLIDHGPPVRYRFDRPGPDFVGQEQTLYLLDYLGTEADFDLARHPTPEFEAVRWVTPAAALELLVPAKRPVLTATLEALTIAS